LLTVFGTAYANEAKAKVNTTLITNVRIFDGKSDKLSEPMSVLVENNKIMTIAKKIGFKKTAFGTDIMTDPETVKWMNEELVFRTKWFSNDKRY
jgi:hypothetical protein